MRKGIIFLLVLILGVQVFTISANADVDYLVYPQGFAAWINARIMPYYADGRTYLEANNLLTSAPNGKIGHNVYETAQRDYPYYRAGGQPGYTWWSARRHWSFVWSTYHTIYRVWGNHYFARWYLQRWDTYTAEWR